MTLRYDVAAWGKIEGRTNIRWGRGGEKVWGVRQSSPVTMTHGPAVDMSRFETIYRRRTEPVLTSETRQTTLFLRSFLHFARETYSTVIDGRPVTPVRRGLGVGGRLRVTRASDASARPQCVTAKLVILALTGRRRCFVRQGLFHHFTIFTSLVHHLMTLGATTRSTLGRLMGARR